MLNLLAPSFLPPQKLQGKTSALRSQISQICEYLGQHPPAPFVIIPSVAHIHSWLMLLQQPHHVVLI